MDAPTHRIEQFTGLATSWKVLIGGGGPPLLFLHGEEGQRGWLPHHRALAERFTVAAPTMPGIDGSDKLVCTTPPFVTANIAYQSTWLICN